MTHKKKKTKFYNHNIKLRIYNVNLTIDYNCCTLVIPIIEYNKNSFIIVFILTRRI